ncbi:MAG: DUF4038 domain-containing protein, partial [Firmicutes bacterium]|nr:DUF4038 domain-containing protein [Bacillota bacterium]
MNTKKIEKITKPWENGLLNIKGRYFFNGNTPFFWLGDTAWLIFANTNLMDAKKYLLDRSEKGFTVIQACLMYAAEGMEDLNKMPVCRYDIKSKEYWAYCDEIIEYAEELGLYMALLPSWGSIVKNNILSEENADEYALYLIDRYRERKNIIWILGGDIKAAGYENIYNILGDTFKKNDSSRLIGFHPFGRCSSTQWFKDAKWLDFNMFQSGHRRYDQAKLNAWDDTAEFFGEDNWRYVLKDHKLSPKPTLDGEPSYEQILQGLHDPTQPYWQACDVRRYAYWSVFAGAAGHTYGDNSVMQFYTGKTNGVTYGAKDDWHDALSHEGSFQMGYLKNLMIK